MLISERNDGAPRSLAALAADASERGLDRRTFLRRSGLAAGGFAALGALSLGACAKRRPRPPPPAGAQVTIRKSICTHCAVGCTVTAEVANGVWIGQEPSWDSPINRGSHCAKGASVRELVQRRAAAQISDEARQRPVDAGHLGPGDQRDRRQAAGDPRRNRGRTRSIGSARPR